MYWLPRWFVDDPSWPATRDDLRRLAWVLALVWLALAGFTALAQRFLGWRLAVGLIGGAGALFSIGLLLVAAGSLAAASVERRLAARRDRAEDAKADSSTSECLLASGITSSSRTSSAKRSGRR